MRKQMIFVSRIMAVGVLAAVLGACSPADEKAADLPQEVVDMPGTEQVNGLTADEAAEGWQLLFDGTSTDAWRGYNRQDFPSDSWKVEDGTLVVVGSTGDMPGGDIVTKETFKDFELRLEFKVSPGGNSGIFFRVLEEDSMEVWQTAVEYQILDDDAYVAEGIRPEDGQFTGDNYDMHPSTGRILEPVGEWNHARLLVKGDHVEHWLNGVKVVEYEFGTDDWARRYAESKFVEFPGYATAETAPIGLQDHGTRVWFRNIKIRRL